MRERLIGLIGPRQINVTTQAMGEASYRVSRYLYMQLVVNMMFGIPFGIALYFIGVPNAMLWGLLGTLLRLCRTPASGSRRRYRRFWASPSSTGGAR